MSGTKNDSGKPKLELLSRTGLEKMAKVVEFGANKYSLNNWKQGMDWSRLIGASLRHIMAFNSGEDTDPESGESHLAHAAVSLMFLLEYEETQRSRDDRYRTKV